MTDDPLSKLRELSYSSLSYTKRAEPMFMPIQLTGGIGDNLMAIDLLKKLSVEYQTLIHTKHALALKYFCPDLNITTDHAYYTWSLELDTFARFRLHEGFSRMFNSYQLYYNQLRLFDKDPILAQLVYVDHQKYYLIAEHAKRLGLDRRSFAPYSLGLKIKLPFDTKPRATTSNYITIHDGYDIQLKHLSKDRATKTWNMDSWRSLVKMINQKFPILKIIQLGSPETARPIDGVECLIGKTTLSQAFDILSHSLLHIDGDSGLVHAARRMQVPSVVMFGPTPKDFYGYKENINITSNACSYCYGVVSDWPNRCLITNDKPLCMDEIKPDQVFEAVNQLLS